MCFRKQLFWNFSENSSEKIWPEFLFWKNGLNYKCFREVFFFKFTETCEHELPLLNCRANQWTGFYMIETSVMKELTLLQKLQINSLVFPNQGSDKNCFNDYEFESTLQESDFNYKRPIESFFSTGAAIKWCSQMFPINTCEGINVIMKLVWLTSQSCDLTFLTELESIAVSTARIWWQKTLSTFSNSILTLPTPWISESCIKIKINLNFYFHTFFGASKGFMKTFKAFTKPFKAPQKNKNLSWFFLFILEWNGKGHQ